MKTKCGKKFRSNKNFKHFKDHVKVTKHIKKILRPVYVFILYAEKNY